VYKRLIKKSQPFGENVRKLQGGIFLTHTVTATDTAHVLASTYV